MNCTESLELLQTRLDGMPIRDRAPLDAHLIECAECRSLHAAAGRLTEGLGLLPRIKPPVHLRSVIVQKVLRKDPVLPTRQPWLRREALYVAAMAASLMFALFLGYGWSGRSGKGDSKVVVVRQEPASLTQSVSEASTAMVSLGRRTAAETVGQTKMLVPEPIPTPPQADSDPVEVALAPPMISLREAQESMTVGLNPVTTSARRAFNLFVRDMNPVAVEQ